MPSLFRRPVPSSRATERHQSRPSKGGLALQGLCLCVLTLEVDISGKDKLAKLWVQWFNITPSYHIQHSALEHQRQPKDLLITSLIPGSPRTLVEDSYQSKISH